MTGAFVISLDCEGKWGMADQTLEQLSWLTSAELREAYDWLLAELDQHGLLASFAFVGALCSDDPEVVRSCRAWDEHPEWFSSYREALERRSLDEWHDPTLVERAAAGGHEIASHSLTHTPMDLAGTSPGLLVDELERWAAVTGRTPTTFVYPRNRVEYVDALPSAHVAGYRVSPYSGGRHSTLRSAVPILRDLNVWQRATPRPDLAADPVAIPQTDFLNHRRGLRGRVPRTLVRRRWEAAIRDAGESDRLVHVWFHPHNLIGHADMRALVREVFAAAGDAVRAGTIESVTQAELIARA